MKALEFYNAKPSGVQKQAYPSEFDSQVFDPDHFDPPLVMSPAGMDDGYTWIETQDHERPHNHQANQVSFSGSFPVDVSDPNGKRPEQPALEPPPATLTDPSQHSGGSSDYKQVSSDAANSSRPGQRPLELPPVITVDQVQEHIKSKSKIPLNGLAGVLQKINGRDQIFLVDDSQSMRRTHAHHVHRTAEALMHLVREVDPDGIELRMASNPTEVIRGRRFFRRRTNKQLVKTIDKFMDHSIMGTCNMEDVLNEVIDQLVSNFQKRRRRTSIFILTDGIWEPNNARGGGVENSIRSLANSMKQHNMARTTIGLQFVQFGNDKVGTSRMRYLDDELPKEMGMPEGFDFVDHRHYTESVYDMLLCATSSAVDQYQSEQYGHNGESSRAIKARGEG